MPNLACTRVLDVLSESVELAGGDFTAGNGTGGKSIYGSVGRFLPTLLDRSAFIAVHKYLGMNLSGSSVHH